MRLRRNIIAVFILINIVIISPRALAQGSTAVVVTAPGQIVKMLSDWGINALLIALSSSVPFQNPAG